MAPVDTSSPRATFTSFRENVEKAYRSWRLRENAGQIRTVARRALRTLDLDHIGEALREEVGVGEALYLYDTLSRIDLPAIADIPDRTAVASQGLTRWTLPGTEISVAKVTEGERAGEFLFTSDTVRRARQFHEQVQDLPISDGATSMLSTWRAAPGLLMPDVVAARIWELPAAGVRADPGTAGVEVARHAARHAARDGRGMASVAGGVEVGQALPQAGSPDGPSVGHSPYWRPSPSLPHCSCSSWAASSCARDRASCT